MITDKHKERIPRLDVMQRVAQEISRSMQVDPKLRVLVGNGAGSYGHVPASLYGTRQGVDSPEEWLGFSQVWYEAAALNRLVIDMLRSAGLPAVAFPPSAAVVTDNSEIIEWNTHSIQSALTAGLLPVVHGDVVFDRQKGGTILSTEDLFSHLAKVLHPQCILLAGIEDGVWGDYPTCTKLIESITPSNFQAVVDKLQGSSAVDVTGGMVGKVLESLKLVSSLPGMEVLIFSGNKPGNIADALLGAKIGTKVWNPAPDDAVSQI